MRKLIILGAFLAASPALALDFSTDTVLGTSMQEVKGTLANMGYEVRKSEMEDGMIEAYFIKGSEKGDVYVNTQTGKVERIKMR